MTKLLLTRDSAGKNTFGLPFASYRRATTLAATVAQTLTIPSASENGYLAIFSYEPGAKVWVGTGASISLPSGSFTDTNAELNPTARNIAGGTTIRFITNDTSTEIGITLYEL